MRKLNKVVATLLVAIMAITILPMTATAAETYGYEVVIDPSPVAIGEEVTLTFRLTDYTEGKSGIRGFQIDITDVDDVLHDAVCTTLVTDTENLLSNTAKYQKSRDIVRHAYVKMSGTMSYVDSDLLEVKIRIPETYTVAGTLSLPLTILIQNAAGDKLTYTDTIVIHYAPAGEIPDQPNPDVVSVDVAWGAMEFVYSEGTWNTKTHSYEGAGWTDNGTGYVTVTNSGSVDTTVAFKYTTERTDIYGNFDVTGTSRLKAGVRITAYLSLSGKPDSSLVEKTVIGTATVTIGGE